MEGKCMGFSPLRGMAYGVSGVWVMDQKPLRTNSVDRIFYGVSQVMGYLIYGL